MCMFVYGCVCVYVCTYVCIISNMLYFFFSFSVPTFYLYTLDIDLFDKLWCIHMEYSVAVAMNELVIHNNMDEFQHHGVEWGK